MSESWAGGTLGPAWTDRQASESWRAPYGKPYEATGQEAVSSSPTVEQMIDKLSAEIYQYKKSTEIAQAELHGLMQETALLKRKLRAILVANALVGAWTVAWLAWVALHG